MQPFNDNVPRRALKPIDPSLGPLLQQRTKEKAGSRNAVSWLSQEAFTRFGIDHVESYWYAFLAGRRRLPAEELLLVCRDVLEMDPSWPLEAMGYVQAHDVVEDALLPGLRLLLGTLPAERQDRLLSVMPLFLQIEEELCGKHESIPTKVGAMTVDATAPKARQQATQEPWSGADAKQRRRLDGGGEA